MKTLEVRRHSLTKKGPGRGKGSHLSQQGVELARTTGETIGQCDLVLVSPVPRTLETAIGLGYAVDDILPVLGEMQDGMLNEIGHYERWAWEKPFEQFAQIIGQGGATAQAAQNLRKAWESALETIPEAGKVLVISHGRLLEIGLIACLPGANFTEWGAPFQQLEGFRLEYSEGRFTKVEFLRVPRQSNFNS